MQIIENSKVKEKLYIEKLDNGLTIMIIPKKGIQKKYIIYLKENKNYVTKFYDVGDGIAVTKRR